MGLGIKVGRLTSIFLILIAVAILYLRKTIPQRHHIKVLKVAFKLGLPLEELDPIKVRSLSEATLLRNLYSSLFEYDDEGQIYGDIAERFSWEKNNLIINLSKSYKTSKGEAITAEDVKISLIRLMVNGNNLHGDLKEILCPGHKLKSWRENCKGIIIEGDHIILKPASDKLKSELVQLLASADYRIIPLSAFDLRDDIPKIKDFTNTSGAYFVRNYDESTITLEANENFKKFAPNYFKIVELTDSYGLSLAASLARHEIDLIPSTVPFTFSDFEEARNLDLKLSIAKTHKLRIRGVFFSQKALRELSIEDRLIVSSSLAMISKKMFSFNFEEDTVQFFQDFADGALTNEQLKKIQKIRNKYNRNARPSRDVTVAIGKATYQKYKHFFREYPFLKPVHSVLHPLQMKQEDRPDTFTMFNDAAFNASLPLINYNIRQGFWGADTAMLEKWLKKYLGSFDHFEKRSLLNKIHFKVLKNVYFFPFTANRYFIVAREGLKIHINPFFSATQLWRIQKD